MPRASRRGQSPAQRVPTGVAGGSSGLRGPHVSGSVPPPQAAAYEGALRKAGSRTPQNSPGSSHEHPESPPRVTFVPRTLTELPRRVARPAQSLRPVLLHRLSLAAVSPAQGSLADGGSPQPYVWLARAWRWVWRQAVEQKEKSR